MSTATERKSGPEPRVISQTESWLAVEKPAHWLTIPGSDPSREPEWPVLTAWASALAGLEGRKLWILHRLDVETSGVILFALTESAHRQASLWFQKHEVRKTYHLLAQGEPPSMPVVKVTHPVRGQTATTQLETRETFSGCGAFLAHASPVTGRRHQIRIHLAHDGRPLLGDTAYGGPSRLDLATGPLSIGRVALHSARLTLPSGERFEAAWPEDFSGWVESLRKGAHGPSSGVV